MYARYVDTHLAGRSAVAGTRHFAVLRHLPFDPQSKVFDIGCGAGDLVVEIERFGYPDVGLSWGQRRRHSPQRSVAPLRARTETTIDSLSSSNSTPSTAADFSTPNIPAHTVPDSARDPATTSTLQVTVPGSPSGCRSTGCHMKQHDEMLSVA